MKKTFAVILVLIAALSASASMAFVLDPSSSDTGSFSGPTDSGLVITGFFATDDTALVTGVRVYADLIDNTDNAYAKNEVIRFAVTGDVQNYNILSNNVVAPSGTAYVFESDTVDLSLSAYPGMVALHKPPSNDLPNAADVVASDSVKKGGVYDADNNTLTAYITVLPLLEGYDSELTPAGFGLGIYFSLDTIAKYSFAYTFSGVTTGDIAEKGSVTMSTAVTDYDTFDSSDTLATPTTVVIKKNSRTYLIEKVTDTYDSVATVKHPVLNTSYGAGSSYTINSDYYLLSKVGYRVYLAKKSSSGHYNLSPVAQLDTESVTYNSCFGTDLAGEEVEGLGYSLGIEKLSASSGLTGVDLTVAPTGVTTELVFMAVLSGDSARYVNAAGKKAFSSSQLTRLNTMLADFGFSTDVNYTYKIEDKYFTAVDDDASKLTATYNNGSVVPAESDEEPDVSTDTMDG